MKPTFTSGNLVNLNCVFNLLQNARNFQDFDCQVSATLHSFHSVLFLADFREWLRLVLCNASAFTGLVFFTLYLIKLFN